MPEFRKKFEDAWSQALMSMDAAEQEAEKVISRVAGLAGFGPDDVRRHAREFGERLRVQRLELERTIDDAVSRLTQHLRVVPTSDEIAALRRRIDAVARRLDELEKARGGEAAGAERGEPRPPAP